jgi:hypothetical protein
VCAGVAVSLASYPLQRVRPAGVQSARPSSRFGYPQELFLGPKKYSLCRSPIDIYTDGKYFLGQITFPGAGIARTGARGRLHRAAAHAWAPLVGSCSWARPRHGPRVDGMGRLRTPIGLAMGREQGRGIADVRGPHPRGAVLRASDAGPVADAASLGQSVPTSAAGTSTVGGRPAAAAGDNTTS